MTERVVIYTDGACGRDSGLGGWAAILSYYKDDKFIAEREMSGRLANTTSNRAEMIAVIYGLRVLSRPCPVTIYTDSDYVRFGLGSWRAGSPVKLSGAGGVGWVVGWHKRNWLTFNDTPVKNIDLWKALLVETNRHLSVDLCWVRGHADNEYNQRCDALAVAAKPRAEHDCLQSNGLPEDRDPHRPLKTRPPKPQHRHHPRPSRPKTKRNRKS